MTVAAFALYEQTKYIRRSRMRISQLPKFLSTKSKPEHTARKYVAWMAGIFLIELCDCSTRKPGKWV